MREYKSVRLYAGDEEMTADTLANWRIRQFSRHRRCLAWEIDTLRDRLHSYFTAPEELYPDRFFEKRFKFRGRRWRAGAALVKHFGLTSLVDFGCGTGSYLEGAMEAGLTRVLGIERLEAAREYAPEGIRDYIRVGNVGQPFECGQWDCVLSVEVAEHLLPEEASYFVANTIRASTRLIVLTASDKYENTHFNPRPMEYWIGKYTLAGCRYLVDGTVELREAWRRAKALRHVRANLMVFEVPK